MLRGLDKPRLPRPEWWCSQLAGATRNKPAGSAHTLTGVLEGTSSIPGPKAPNWGMGRTPKPQPRAASGGSGERRRLELSPGDPRRREAKPAAQTRGAGVGGPRHRKALHQPAHVRPEGREARAAREAVPQSGLSFRRPRPALRAPPQSALQPGLPSRAEPRRAECSRADAVSRRRFKRSARPRPGAAVVRPAPRSSPLFPPWFLSAPASNLAPGAPLARTPARRTPPGTTPPPPAASFRRPSPRRPGRLSPLRPRRGKLSLKRGDEGNMDMKKRIHLELRNRTPAAVSRAPRAPAPSMTCK